ncbi:hypothetical protein BOTNAR_0159g00010 [Botryotinia narcissicola]|uniref:N-acetyltransferase domain-containing protein n=1 Tax=Botryotinia narcissicola TaxID=278944 RepID=A0A4Z1IJ72_9HELO|nr:hypothetical protein BOTNAR_0159g00010 [Botryotinia narcissicola]
MAIKPDFHVSYVDFDKDWDDLFFTYWESWKDPVQVTGVLTFAWLSEGGVLEKRSYESAKKDYLDLAISSPDMHWIKVEDRSLIGPGVNCIVAGGAWTQHRKDPFREHQHTASDQEGIYNLKLPGLGYPVGSDRHRLMCEFYAQMLSWRPKMMARPHAHGQALWALPKYRRLGAAQLALDFFLQKTDDLGLETFLEGSSIGTPLYLRSGYVPIVKPVIVFTPPNQIKKPSEDWRNIVRSLHAETISIMWRPPGGVYTEGETILPWEGKPRRIKL